MRSDAARLAVLTATAALFEERGYDQLTIEGIAARAQVGKQTVYRWWPSKGAIIAECLLEGLVLPETFTPPDTGDLRADFMTWVERIFRVLEQQRGQDLLRSLIAAAAEHPDVGRRLRDALAAEASFVRRLRSAADADQVSPDVPLLELGEALAGTIVLRALSREPIEPATAGRLFDAVLAARHPLDPPR